MKILFTSTTLERVSFAQHEALKTSPSFSTDYATLPSGESFLPVFSRNFD